MADECRLGTQPTGGGWMHAAAQDCVGVRTCLYLLEDGLALSLRLDFELGRTRPESCLQSYWSLEMQLFLCIHELSGMGCCGKACFLLCGGSIARQ